MHPLCSNARHGCCAWSGKVPTETHVIVIADEARMVIYVCNRETNVITGSFFFWLPFFLLWCRMVSESFGHYEARAKPRRLDYAGSVGTNEAFSS